jgi:hypothetical protein
MILTKKRRKKTPRQNSFQPQRSGRVIQADLRAPVHSFNAFSASSTSE